MVSSLLRSLPAIRIFLTSKEIGGEYGVGFRAKFGLLCRFYMNTRKVETLSDFREHMELAAGVLRVPRATEGSVVECGCYVGGSTINLSLVCAMTGRKLIVFDSFEGLPEPKEYDRWHHSVHLGHTDIYYKGRFAAAREVVERNVSRFGDISVCEFRAGYYDKTMSDVSEPVVMAFLDVDLIDSLKPCLKGLWPNLQPGCRIYTHEARNLPLVAVYFDQTWWRRELNEDAPGFVGSGVGLPLAADAYLGSELGYAQKPREVPGLSPDENPEILERALFDSEKAAFPQLQERRPS
ncbi:MAG TPA: TylF/MycF/NovP-related O-methyltransferase [Trebonia sp.]|nr:TylF/MycF/NovP-related O-methyltransferase [Trebonia sp.]